MDLRFLMVFAPMLALTCAAGAEDLLPRRDVFVRPGAPAGGDGSRDAPYSSIQEMVEKHDAEWGQVSLYPGVYEEDVVIHRGRFWFFPAQQYDVILEGSITIRRPGIIIRGMDIRSEGSGIILDEGAKGCQIQQNRIQSVGDGQAGIAIVAEDCSGCLISDNIVDLRGQSGEGRTGIRVRVAAGVLGNRLDHNQILGCETGISFVPGQGISEETNVATSNRLQANGVGMELAAPGVTARYNQFRANTQAAVRATAGPTMLVANRFDSDATAARLDGEGISLHSNVIANSDGPAVAVAGGRARLLHNTLYSADDTHALLAAADGAAVEARHNILVKPGPIIAGDGALDLFGNLYSHEIDAAQADEGAVFAEPQFRDPERGDFHIPADSPAAHKVEAVEIRTDADGVGRPWGRMASIGACEAPGEPQRRTLWVSSGAEAGEGTREAPFGSISAAARRARPGDEIVLADGEYEFGEDVLECAGAPDAPIVIRAESPGRAVVVSSRLRLERCSYVHLRGLRFTEPPSGYVAFGPYCRHCAVVDTEGVREARGGGTGMAVSGPGSQHIRFENNTISLNHGGVGIQIGCQRHNWRQTLRGNDISGCYYGCQTGGGSYPTAPPGYHIIEGNTFHDNWKDGVHTKGTDQIICGNHFYNNAGHAITTRYGARNVIVGNYIHDNGHGIRLHSPSHFVINNLIYNNEGFGIHAASWPGGKEGRFPHNFEPSYEPPHEVWIAHNTIYRNGRGQIDANIGSRLMILRNIIVGNDPDQPGILFARGSAARQVEGNLYWQAQRPLLREYEGGRFSRVAEPMFADPEGGDFRPREGSPAYEVADFDDALSAVLSNAPCGIPLGDHVGASLPPLAAGQ
ncbi:MAG: right-handed parallel beta-helix repeat-containing protein [Armatimonadota bacterium]|nr:right-handed parallel beta-helix repeat-containing protein [Armatimonadota bacterium]